MRLDKCARFWYFVTGDRSNKCWLKADQSRWRLWCREDQTDSQVLFNVGPVYRYQYPRMLDRVFLLSMVMAMAIVVAEAERRQQIELLKICANCSRQSILHSVQLVLELV